MDITWHSTRSMVFEFPPSLHLERDSEHPDPRIELKSLLPCHASL